MILDTVLLTVAKILTDVTEDQDAALLPEMRLSTGDEVCVTNPATGYEVCLSGNVDYGIILFPDRDGNRG
jgi:hypothetical protein